VCNITVTYAVIKCTFSALIVTGQQKGHLAQRSPAPKL